MSRMIRYDVNYGSGFPLIEINVKNIKTGKIFKEKHGIILGNVYFCTIKKLGNV